MALNIAVAQEVRAVIKKLSGWQKSQVNYLGKKMFTGHEMHNSFIEPQPFFIFWCDHCERYTKDHPHGFIEKRYLICAHCKTKYDFTPWWIEWVELWRVIKFAMKHRKSA